MADEMRTMSRAGRAPRLVEPEETVPPLLWVVSREADNVNGHRFDTTSGTRHSRPPSRVRDAPAIVLTIAGLGHSSGKPIRRRPTFSVFSRRAQWGGYAFHGTFARCAANELISGFSLSDSARAAFRLIEIALKAQRPRKR
jgi:hypothetical protein